ncbi:magnesium transporter CorA [Elizabethkingia argentiflava]|uniref:Magnesium transporter CorA n=1 Tax=Elizabethkingia argenteiflava TaxID=2681556 RepID=A0A845PWA6_9FLAO|nr:CorA family divalent cation transporter [Elizabethkingia argenteiflava]NAW52124.1 magnesium transporter CorA [Elizabethkingia argenteiflava]
MPTKVLFQQDNCKWIDVSSPTDEDLKSLQTLYNINKLLLQDTIASNHLPKYEETQHVKFFLTRENTIQERPNLKSISDISTKIGIFITDETIITIHLQPRESITHTKKELDSLKNQDQITPDKIALKIAYKVIKSFDHESEHILNVLDKIESDIFLKKKLQPNPIRHLYKLKRKTGLNLRILNISTDWVHNFDKLSLDPVEVMDLIVKQKNAIANFEHLNQEISNTISLFLALSDQKNNEAMKLLSMYSVYFLPITFIAGIYGMNFRNMPELEQEYAYYICLGVMALIALFTFIYFRRKKM